MKNASVAIFVPHQGCPFDCLFCDQKKITAVNAMTPSIAGTIMDDALKTIGDRPYEIAFFGGSFTGIGVETMTAYLEEAEKRLIGRNAVGIRLSTRPDYIDDNILDILKAHRVTTIELGVQSMEESVLLKNGRGHTPADSERAAKAVKAAGINVVLQLMAGMYGDSADGFERTVEKIIELSPSGVRIYPVLVLPDTGLWRLYEKGEYALLPLDSAVEMCSRAMERFNDNGIDVVKVGLHYEPELYRCAAGPKHPAFAELCMSEIYLRRAEKAIGEKNTGVIEPGTSLKLFVRPGYVSAMTGQKRSNINALKAKYGFKSMKIFESEGIELYDIRAEFIH